MAIEGTEFDVLRLPAASIDWRLRERVATPLCLGGFVGVDYKLTRAPRPAEIESLSLDVFSLQRLKVVGVDATEMRPFEIALVRVKDSEHLLHDQLGVNVRALRQYANCATSWRYNAGRLVAPEAAAALLRAEFGRPLAESLSQEPTWLGSSPSAPPGATEDYYRLRDVLIVLALKRRSSGLRLPSCAFELLDRNGLAIHYFDGINNAPIHTVRYTFNADRHVEFAGLCRLLDERNGLRDKETETWLFGGARGYGQFRKLRARRYSLDRRIQSVYRGVAARLAKRRAQICAVDVDLSPLRNRPLGRLDAERYALIPSNIEGLPVHLAMLPVGSLVERSAGSDDEGFESLELSRPTFRGPTVSVRLTMPPGRQRQDYQTSLDLFFGPGQRQGLLAQGFVAMCGLLDQAGLLRGTPGEVTRVFLGDFCAAMRPDQESRIRTKGVQGIFGHGLEALAVMRGVLDFMEGITLPYGTDAEQGCIRGIVKTLAEGTVGPRRFTDLIVNPRLVELLCARGARPLVMLVNRKAMFCWRGSELGYLPAAQLSLELLFRQNLPRSGGRTVVTPEGDGVTRRTLLHRFGLTQERPAIIKSRFDRLLGRLQDAGVLEGVAVDGRERSQWLDTKLFLTSDRSYEDAYRSPALRRKRASLEQGITRLIWSRSGAASTRAVRENPLRQ